MNPATEEVLTIIQLFICYAIPLIFLIILATLINRELQRPRIVRKGGDQQVMDYRHSLRRVSNNVCSRKYLNRSGPGYGL